MSQIQLSNVSWSIDMIGVCYSLNKEELEYDEFLEGLSCIPTSWTSLPSESESIILLYPVTSGEQLIREELVEAKKYKISELTNVLQLHNEINKFYRENLINCNLDLPDRIMTNETCLHIRFPRSKTLFVGEFFQGIMMVKQGVYHILIGEPYNHE